VVPLILALAVCRRDKLFHNKNRRLTADRVRIRPQLGQWQWLIA
jgi:hypothetical protein